MLEQPGSSLMPEYHRFKFLCRKLRAPCNEGLVFRGSFFSCHAIREGGLVYQGIVGAAHVRFDNSRLRLAHV